MCGYQKYNGDEIEHSYDHRRNVRNSRKVDMREICAAIYLHPVALIFVNIIVDQIWLKAKIFRLLMDRQYAQD